MSYIGKFMKKQPLIFSVIVVALALTLAEIPLKQFFLPFCSNQLAGYINGVITQGILGTVLVVMLNKLGFSRLCGLYGPKSWGKWWLLWPEAIVIILCAVPFPSNIDTSQPVTIIAFILVFLSTGYYEESLFRGMVLSSFLLKWGNSRKGIYLSALLSSVFFAIAHMPGLLKDGSFLAIAPYLIPCFFNGVFFAAYALRSKSLWLTMLIHGLGDIAQNLSAITIGSNVELTRMTASSFSWEEFLVSTLVTLPLCLYGLFILRKVKD